MELLSLNDGYGSVACTLLFIMALTCMHDRGLYWGWGLLVQQQIPTGMGAIAGVIVQ